MPRIDPLQLLNCLSVLLGSNGGIKSTEEVSRLANLMTKFSKKLVSKCIYVQILRNTETELLGRFMGGGGWNLVHQWLSDAILAQNLPFIKELLELLLMCPVDVERLKLNNCPKLIKNLTKEASNEEVRQLASSLVEQWLRIVKGQAAASADSEVMKVEAVPEPVVVEPSAEEVENAVETAIVEAACEVAEPVTEREGGETEAVEPAEEEAKVEVKEQEVDLKVSEDSNDASAWDAPNGTLPVYKITYRDGKQLLSKVSTTERTPRKQSFDSATLKHDVPKITTNIVVKRSPDPLPVEKKKVDSASASTALSAKSKKVKSESESDIKKRVKNIQKKIQDNAPSEKKIKLIEPSKEKPMEATNEKERVKERRERELLKLKEKKLEKAAAQVEKAAAQLEKDKATLAKLVPPPISKLGKIPKKPRLEDGSKPGDKKPDEKKSPDHKRSPLSPDLKRSSSSDSRKPSSSSSSSQSRPKTTIKQFNSKFRSTGLEEESKPPSKSSSSRRLSSSSSSDKKTTSKPDLKRVSPTKDGVPPEKKPKVSETPVEEPKKVEKPIQPKPKRLVIQESDMFMDALITSTKKDVRKRKRRISASKDGVPDVKKEKEKDDDTPPASPTVEDNLSPAIKPAPKFYRDTLETSDLEKDVKTEGQENGSDNAEAATSEKSAIGATSPPSAAALDGLSAEQASMKVEKSAAGVDEAEDENAGKFPRGVLVHHKTRKGPKKSVRWKKETELESIQFFELDETERVNVTKTFTDMKQMERTTEREAFQASRKLPQDDNMEEKTVWKFPVLIDVPKSDIQWGCKSTEREVQYAREKQVLSVLYFNRASIPDSAAEPEMQNHPAKDPVVIPLEDPSGNPDTISDFRAQGWPEPKPLAAPVSPAAASVFPTQFVPFAPGPAASGPAFNNMTPSAAPMFPPNNMLPGAMVPNGVGPGPMGGDWRTGDGRVVAMDGSNMPMDMYNQQGGPAMGMGMPGVMGPGGGPGGHMDMGYGMMPGPEDMQQYPMQGYPMQGPPMGPGGPMGMPPMQGPPMGFPQFRGPMGPRGNRPPGGQWFRPNGAMGPGPHWRGGSRGWNRGMCRQFSSRGTCRMGSNCAFTH